MLLPYSLLLIFIHQLKSWFWSFSLLFSYSLTFLPCYWPYTNPDRPILYTWRPLLLIVLCSSVHIDEVRWPNSKHSIIFDLRQWKNTDDSGIKWHLGSSAKAEHIIWTNKLPRKQIVGNIVWAHLNDLISRQLWSVRFYLLGTCPEVVALQTGLWKQNPQLWSQLTYPQTKAISTLGCFQLSTPIREVQC